MKVSLAIIAGLSAISSASPTPKEVDILLTVKVEDNAPIAAKQSSHISTSNSLLYPPGPCLMVCWPESPQCPTGWDATNMTPNEEDYPCWTCCKHPDDDALAAKPHKKAPKFVEAAPTENIFVVQFSCLHVCWPSQYQCPDGWSPLNSGTDSHPCWTCCLNEPDDDFVAEL